MLPFAGLEVAFVAIAFRSLARHDGDYERLEIEGRTVRLRLRRAARAVELEGHAPWARLVVEEGPGRLQAGPEVRGQDGGIRPAAHRRRGGANGPRNSVAGCR